MRYFAKAAPLVVVFAALTAACSSASSSASGHRSSDSISTYAALVQADRERWSNSISSTMDGCGMAPGTLNAPASCPAATSKLVAETNRWIGDLDRAQPPTELRAVHARLRVSLVAFASDNQQVVAALNGGNTQAALVDIGAAEVEGKNVDRMVDYVVLRGKGGTKGSDAASTDYAAMVARDYDRLQPSTVSSRLVACNVGVAVCAADLPVAKKAISQFLADLQSSAPARFAARKNVLVVDLEGWARALDEFGAAYAAGDATSLLAAKVSLIQSQSQVDQDAGYIMYGS